MSLDLTWLPCSASAYGKNIKQLFLVLLDFCSYMAPCASHLRLYSQVSCSYTPYTTSSACVQKRICVEKTQLTRRTVRNFLQMTIERYSNHGLRNQHSGACRGRRWLLLCALRRYYPLALEHGLPRCSDWIRTRSVPDIHPSIVCKRTFYSRQVLMVLLAPIMKDVGIHYEEVRFNGSLFLSNAYRMDAGPEVDAAWKSLGVDCKCVEFFWMEVYLKCSPRSCSESTGERSTAFGPCFRSGQDQRRIRRRIPRTRRRAAPFALPRKYSHTPLPNNTNTLVEPTAQVFILEL